ncbi:hypothetical protein [Pseudomonas brassicacearum]|uniref:hypothetical protein n=1 Tax=Pseudomonas brassicacearum TaxID=930166 RepID=UPI00071F91BE|nr:hypothetical protein [Pseudomonas brassicacearum]ALQ01444.1 hypothetical protein AK973_0995 [Pseudomonas brassicacearum]
MESVKRYWSSEVFDRGITKNQWTRAEDFDRVTAERDALQLLLNERDEQVHSLEQRRQAEQQAGQAAEREAVRYRFLRKVTPYRFKKMQDAATTDGGDVLYFHADRFDTAIDAAIIAAEAVSHEL